MAHKLEEKELKLEKGNYLSEELLLNNGTKKLLLKDFFAYKPEVLKTGQFTLIKGYSSLLNKSMEFEGGLSYKTSEGKEIKCTIETQSGEKVNVLSLTRPIIQWFDKKAKDEQLTKEFFSGVEQTQQTEEQKEEFQTVDSGLVIHPETETYQRLKEKLLKAGFVEQVFENYRFFNGEEPILLLITEYNLIELEHSKDSSTEDTISFVGDDSVVQVSLSEEGLVQNIQKIQLQTT